MSHNRIERRMERKDSQENKKPRSLKYKDRVIRSIDRKEKRIEVKKEKQKKRLALRVEIEFGLNILRINGDITEGRATIDLTNGIRLSLDYLLDRPEEVKGIIKDLGKLMKSYPRIEACFLKAKDGEPFVGLSMKVEGITYYPGYDPKEAKFTQDLSFQKRGLNLSLASGGKNIDEQMKLIDRYEGEKFERSMKNVLNLSVNVYNIAGDSYLVDSGGRTLALTDNTLQVGAFWPDGSHIVRENAGSNQLIISNGETHYLLSLREGAEGSSTSYAQSLYPSFVTEELDADDPRLN